jgi:1,3-beta-glucanosyltransferase GAS5
MFAFGEAGIYIVVRLDGIFTSPAEMIGSEGTNVFYDYVYIDALKASIDIFQKYPNTLGFLVRASSNPYALTYSKSMIRDLKDYIEEKGYRAIPVGALNVGFTADRLAAAEYLNCGEMHHFADFFALLFTIEEQLGCDNMIEMLQTRLVDDWRGYSVPSYIHYGCPANKSVDFTQVQVLYNNDTTKVFSGGVVHDLIANSGNSFDAGEFLALFQSLFTI